MMILSGPDTLLGKPPGLKCMDAGDGAWKVPNMYDYHT